MESDVLNRAIRNFVLSVEKLLQDAKEAVEKTSVDIFINSKLGILNGLMQFYKQLYLDTGCSERKKLEKKWSRICTKDGVMESIESLLQCEDSVDKFLEGIDERLSTGSSSTSHVCVDDRFPSDIQVLDMNSQTTQSFASLLSSKANCQNFIVVLLRHFA